MNKKVTEGPWQDWAGKALISYNQSSWIAQRHGIK
jgi:hypothetical protein